MAFPTNILWLGDSIFSTFGYQALMQTALGQPLATMDFGAYGGTTLGTGMCDLADESYAFVNSAWSSQKRGSPWSNYNAICFEYGRNDANNAEVLAGFRKGYDKLIAQARKFSGVVVCSTCPPQANGGQTAWDPTIDAMLTGSYYTTLKTVIAKYNVPFFDTILAFQNLVIAATYTVGQLMRDIYHPTVTTGETQIVNGISPFILSKSGAQNAAPEISGKVVNYFFGQPIGGTFAIAAQVPASASPIFRNTGLTEQAMVSSANGDVLRFPSSNGSQIWAHFFVNTPGGLAGCYVDGVLQTTFDTSPSGNGLNTNSVLVADGLAAGPHYCEIRVASANPVRVIGVTHVGA